MNLINFVYGAAALGFGALVPLYAQDRYGIQPLGAGTLLTARAVGMIAIAGLAAMALRRTGYRMPMIAGFLILAAGLLMMASAALLSPYAWLAIAAAATGCGMGLSVPASNNASLQLAPDQVAAIAGLRRMFRQSGSITAVSVTTALIARGDHPGLVQAHVFLVFAVLLVLLLPLILDNPLGLAPSRSPRLAFGGTRGGVMAEWDIVTGVGITALGVAAVRAIETRLPGGLIDDPYAEAFVRAAQAPAPIPVTPEEAASDTGFPWLSLATYTALRTKFFDESLKAAAGVGIPQVVILAAGLDSRAFRLDWPPSTTVYEIDTPLVLRFKDEVLNEQGARPRCERHTVAADLRAEWPTALRQAGFDPARPTAWLAEGLLPYLTDDAKDALLTRVHDASAPGSQVALEFMDADISELVSDPAIQEAASRVDWDFTGMWPADQRHDPASWLTQHGWDVSINPIAAVSGRYRRPLDGLMPAMRSGLLITANLAQPRPADG